MLSFRPRRAALLAWCLVGGLGVSHTQAQPADLTGSTCSLLPGPHHPSLVSVPPPARLAAEHAGKTEARSSFTIEFLSGSNDDRVFGYRCKAWPHAAKRALRQATKIWSSVLDSSVPIAVEACWTDDMQGAVAQGLPLVDTLATYFGKGPHGTHGEALYPTSLINAQERADLYPAEPDMRLAFNAAYPFWTFRLDGATFRDSLDFVTVGLHELSHGLGFAGNMNYDDGQGVAECNGVAGTGCWHSLPTAYDLFTEDEGGHGLVDTGVYQNPSTALGTALTRPGNVRFGGHEAGGSMLYAPPVWRPGASYSHLDAETYPDQLMKHATSRGQAIHSPGVALGVLRDIGWSLAAALPVELVSFEAYADGMAVELTWATASELANAGFAVEQSTLDGAFERVAFVEGAGTSTTMRRYHHRLDELRPGRYRFRLKQVDLDGLFRYSLTTEVVVEAGGSHYLTAYPNPLQGRGTVELTVGRHQQVRAALYNALGQHVMTLYEGAMSEGDVVRMEVSAERLASGLYVVRVEGEEFVDSRRLTLVR